MKQINYQMDVTWGRIDLCDSYITGIEVQGDATIFTFSNGVMTNLHTPDQRFERTGEAACRIEHDNPEDILCHVRKNRYWFGMLLQFGKEIDFPQLIEEVNNKNIRLEIIREYYYGKGAYWICAYKHDRRNEFTIRMDTIKQFELTMQVSDT